MQRALRAARAAVEDHLEQIDSPRIAPPDLAREFGRRPALASEARGIEVPSRPELVAQWKADVRDARGLDLDADQLARVERDDVDLAGAGRHVAAEDAPSETA